MEETSPTNPPLGAKPPILVTGAHRSGTTWVGQMLTASREAAYISEPLNILHRPGVFAAPTTHWYTYICQENQDQFLPALRQTLRFRYHTWAEIRSLRSRKDFLRMLRDWNTFLFGRLGKKRAVLKDPFAFFSAPWFASTLDCQVVITLRHPAAFASSLKRLDWPFDFKDLLAQPLLMRHVLSPFREDMEKALQASDDVIGLASLLWRILYSIVAQYQTQYPHFHIVRHEDLSLDPVEGFRVLYEKLGLHFTPRARETILKASSAENPKELSKRNIYAVQLDSRANLRNWKKRLSPGEIQRVRQITQEVASLFYPEEDWES
ncbi:MAG: sulfotransferase [Chloroflexota bacterium]